MSKLTCYIPGDVIVHAQIHGHAHVSNTHTHTHTHTYTHTYTHIYVHSHTYTHACAHAHTHTHTHTQRFNKHISHAYFLFIIFLRVKIWTGESNTFYNLPNSPTPPKDFIMLYDKGQNQSNAYIMCCCSYSCIISFACSNVL